MMVERWTRKRDMGDDNENNGEDPKGHGKSVVSLA
jgi:hypothetical protein